MPQIIPLVVTAITAVTSAVVAAGPLAVAAFNAANIIGAAALANEAFKAVQPQVKSSSTAIEWNADPNAPNRFAFGRIGGAGNIIHNATYGPDKMYVGFVGVMSASGPIKSWVAFKADDAFVSFNGSGMATNTEYAGEMNLVRQRGLQPEASYLPSPAGQKNGAVMPRWGASYKLSGKAAYHYTLAENSKRSAFRGKVPTGIHYIEGIYCYDPRFDSTFPGGTGPCRLDDPTTWVYSTNAYIHGLNWAIGRWEGEAREFTPKRYGVPYASMKVGGIGAAPDAIDFAGYVEAANVFDENAWACAAWPDADQGKGAVLDSFLQAGGGIYAERQGKISCLHRAAPRTSVVTITADDTAGTIEYDTTTSLLERINTIRPEYWSEAHGWQMVATDEVTSSVWREEDGQGVEVTRSKGLAYNYVPGSKQARELAALQIAHTREGIRGTAPLRHYLDLEVGDCFTFEVPEAVLNGLKCIVLNVDPDLENDIINVTFASESDGKYPFAFGQAAAPPPAPGLQPADNTVSPPQIGDWTIIVRPPSPGGSQLPGFDLTGIVSNSTATAIIVEWGLPPVPPPPEPIPEGKVWADYVTWTTAYQGPPTVTKIPIDGLQPGASYYVAIQYQRNQNYSARQVYGPYTAPELIGDVMPNAPGLSQIKADIQAAFGDIFDVSGLLADARADIDSQGAEIAAARGGQPNLNSRIVQVNQARIDGDEANAQAISLVEARTGNTEADIIDLENAAANDRTATAQAISQVSARQNLLPNKIRNGDFRSVLANYTQSGTGWIIGTSGGPGAAYAFCGADGQQDLWTDYYPVDTNLSFAFMGSRSGAGVSLNLVIEWWTATTQVDFGTVTIVPQGGFQRIVVENDARPTTATRFRILARKLGTGGNVAFTLLKVNTGAYATPWSDDQDAKAVQASVTEQSLAIIDLENQQAIASWRIKSEASGSKPAIIEAVSALGGSFIALGAEQIYFGDNTVFDDVTDTFQTEVDGNVYVRAEGAPFGLGDILREWWGPSGIALSAMTPANGYSGRMTTPPYVFDNMGPGFSARANSSRATGSRSGAGSVTTGAIVIKPTGATATVEYRWWYISGDTSLVIGTTSGGASATWQTSLAALSSKTAVWGWSATMSGQSHTGIVEVLAQSL